MQEKFTLSMFQGTFPQLIAVLAGTLGSISDGMHYGWSAPAIQILKSENSPVELGPNDVRWLETLYMIGGFAGLPITIFAVDKIGRKGSILISAVISLISWLLIGLANRVEYLYVARFMVGLSADVAFVAAPMYIAEIADEKIRGFLAGIVYVMMLVGILIIYAVAPYVQFYVSSIIGIILVSIQLITFPFMPDSPYYQLSRENPEKAKLHLQRLRGTENVEAELKDITAAVERQQTEKGRPQDLVLSKSNRKAVLIMFVLNGAQHLSSMSVILMNLHDILSAADSVYMSSKIAGILFALMMLMSAIISDFVIDKFGRKPLLITSCLLTGCSLLVLAIFFSLKKTGMNVDYVSWIPLVSVMVYAVVFKFGLGIIPIVMTAELFPANVKAMGMTIADFFYVLFGWFSIEIFQRLSMKVGYDVPFYIFSICTLLTAVFVQAYVPETKGKTLEEIQFILKGIPFPHKSNSIPCEYFENGSDKIRHIQGGDVSGGQQCRDPKGPSIP
ncbi:facilitated trehalose transporter Tret1 [Leptinotarsa decemlineata]|uniref:facilitated trehalose transporter Tret1 n=1 Tax=Leptinotarsa decemlineata TaxID=7539 RepID=UPI000C255073|nr:facilitated trehalose transporter Tret1-like [Leptinotarsa decemlineata]XP_023023495.1 facilitated trehalose transporter Tret1-like [Leptinotarsa decemlineata]